MRHTTRHKPGAVDQQLLEMQVRICKAFANAIRLRMLDLLGEGEWAAADLQRELGVTRPNLSQHLAILKAAGVVATRREGKQIYCSLAIAEVGKMCHLVRNVLKTLLKRGQSLPL